MQEQLKTVHSESKGKGSFKVSSANEELQFLMDFNASITQAAAKTMEHLTEFVFISMGNLTLARRDAYLNHLKSGIKPDTVAAHRTRPTLFPDSVIKRAEEEIAHYESKGQASSRSKGRYHPYERTEKRSDKRSDNSKGDRPAWKNIVRASRPINDNYCIDKLQRGLLARNQIPTRQTIDTCVNFHVVKVAHIAPGHSQKKEISPGAAVCYYPQREY